MMDKDSYSLKIDGGSENGTQLVRVDHQVKAMSSWDALDQGYKYVQEQWGHTKNPSFFRISVKKLTQRDKEFPM